MASVGRIFVGVDLDDDTRYGLAAYLADWLPRLPGQVVPPDNWHLTLRFLGDLNEVLYDRLLHALEEEVRGPAFTLSFSGLGAFPNPSRASVVWLGVDQGEPELELAAEQVSAACSAIGIPPEDRSFQAHLTLARIRQPADVWDVLEREPMPTLRMPVNGVTLFRTDFSHGKAAYERLDVIEW